MYSRIETITPEIAKEYMKHNKNNRTIKERAIQNYIRDIKSGNWQLSPQGISFKENGDLFDGQNRLLAVIRANQPADFYVTYDVPNGCTIADRGVPRSSADTLRIGGVSSAAATTNGISCVNALFAMAGKLSVSDSVRESFVIENESMICEAINLPARGPITKNKLCKKAPCMAATFCALYCDVPADTLVDFFTKVNTGFYDGVTEGSTSALRTYLLQDYTGKSSTERLQLFAITTVAIRDFANKSPRTNKYRTNISPAYWKFVKKNAIDKYLESYK